MTREKAEEIIITLDDLIEEALNKYREDIAKIVIKYFKEKEKLEIELEEAIKNSDKDKEDEVKTEIKTLKEESTDKIFDLMCDALEEVYKITIKTIKKNYKYILPFKIKKDILELTYNTDGKTLKERISEHFEKDLSKLKMIKKLDNLLLNESELVKNHVLKKKLGRKANILIIECNENDCNLRCSQYEGEYPADENISLPPYHPNCECSMIIIETDDEDDINDLDLEVED